MLVFADIAVVDARQPACYCVGALWQWQLARSIDFSTKVNFHLGGIVFNFYLGLLHEFLHHTPLQTHAHVLLKLLTSFSPSQGMLYTSILEKGAIKLADPEIATHR